MNLLKWFSRKHVIRCPKCRSELNLFYYGPENSLLLGCVECTDNIYYLKKANSNTLTLTEIPHILNKQLAVDKYQKNYKGFPVSEAFEPNWIKVVRKLLARNR